MRVCVDTTILLDILKDEFRSFQDKLYAAVKCPQCGRKLNLKEHFLSDFYIGGFALAKCSAILTRDRGVYTRYFPSLAGYEHCLNL